MSDIKIRLGITHGDINGIGYEVILKTLQDIRIFEICTPIIYGSPKIAGYHRKTLNIANFNFNHIKTVEEANSKRANIINCVDENLRVELGKSTPMAGEASYHALEKACNDLLMNKIDCLVTAPINKHNIQNESFKFPGHTEYLVQRFSPDKTGLMFMVSPNLKVGVVAGHVPVSQITAHITEENILQKLRIMNKSLIEDFNISKPKIAVLGLNPHAGDEGLIGNEEETIIIPTLNKAREEQIMALGPYAADGFFGSLQYSKFDAVLAMYHDQGLTAFKLIAFDEGVNFTAGLTVIRTSPAHGTAYEIAGEDKANPDSFRNAIYTACDIYNNRKAYKELTENSI